MALLASGCGDNSAKNLSMTDLKVGIATNYKPFDYKIDSKLTGFDVDLVEEIAKKNGIKI
ncbi:transporter substrate-binding domain-containing protein, partial [Campylobacter aviculae]